MKRKPNFIKRSIGAENILIPIGAQLKSVKGIITLNNTGAYLWDLLAEDMTIDGLTAALVAQFEVTYERARADVEHFFRELDANGMIG